MDYEMLGPTLDAEVLRPFANPKSGRWGFQLFSFGGNSLRGTVAVDDKGISYHTLEKDGRLDVQIQEGTAWYRFVSHSVANKRDSAPQQTPGREEGGEIEGIDFKTHYEAVQKTFEALVSGENTGFLMPSEVLERLARSISMDYHSRVRQDSPPVLPYY